MTEPFELGPIDVTDPRRRADLLELMRAIEIADEQPEPSVEADLDDRFEDPNFEPTTDLIVARTGQRLVGWSWILWRPSSERRIRCYVNGGVHPDHRRQGLGTALLEWGERRSRELMADGDPTLPRWILTDALESQDDFRALATSLGFEEQRWFIDMKRSLDDLPELIEPDGIRIAAWTDEHNDAVRRVNADSFGDHWGSTPLDESTWRHLLASRAARLDLSFVALDGDEVVGYSFNEAWPEADRPGERVAWIGSLGTLRTHRRRGIAGSLLDHSHVRFAEAGFTHAMLDVDADSPTGAGSIYEGRGYRPLYRTVAGVKEYRQSG